EQISSGKELDRKLTDKYNLFNELLRKNISPDAFHSDIYKIGMASFREPEETADIEGMRRDFGLKKDRKIYVVKRDFFNYFLIEEDGALKIFTISLRTNKMF